MRWRDGSGALQICPPPSILVGGESPRQGLALRERPAHEPSAAGEEPSMPDNEQDFTISSLGECVIPSPIGLSRVDGDMMANYVDDDDLVRYSVAARPGAQPPLDRAGLLEKAGPRESIYFNPLHVRAGIVSCGGLCPGLNDVIRALVRCLWLRYGVRRVSGIRFGYKGFLPEYGLSVKELDPAVVDDIHTVGGTVLGSSRGDGERTPEIVDAIERLNLNILFTIGGDGTLRGAMAIDGEIKKRGLKIAVVGIPKTIDNDLCFIDRSFGFETAVARAAEAVKAAHAEAHSAMNGLGLVKLMGRESGFIAVHTALASHEVNFVLIPETGFDLDGPRGLLSRLEERLERSGHAVIVVAEGAGQEYLAPEGSKDASGNRRLSDIGAFLRERIAARFEAAGKEINIKYIDPSYMIRSAAADPGDSAYCERLGNNAAHAAMSGKTGLLIGVVNGEFVHIPIKASVAQRRRVDPEGSLWRDAIDATQQPSSLRNEKG